MNHNLIIRLTVSIKFHAIALISRGRGAKKECVVAMIERSGAVKTTVQKRLRFQDLKGIVDNNINIYTLDLVSFFTGTLFLQMGGTL